MTLISGTIQWRKGTALIPAVMTSSVPLCIVSCSTVCLSVSTGRKGLGWFKNSGEIWLFPLISSVSAELNWLPLDSTNTAQTWDELLLSRVQRHPSTSLLALATATCQAVTRNVFSHCMYIVWSKHTFTSTNLSQALTFLTATALIKQTMSCYHAT